MGRGHLTEDARSLLLEALVVGGSAAIEGQERRGQQKLANSGLLPKKINHGTREQFEAMGVRFHADDGDELFVRADLPDGWKVERTDHSMWSNLVDEKGRKRASIFYKAAWYDREAFMSISRRFTYTHQPVGGWEGYDRETTPFEGIVQDGDEIIHRTAPQDPRDDQPQDWKNTATERATRAAGEWLTAQFPEHADPLAYWTPDLITPV